MKLTIIGAGPGGYVAAIKAAQLGVEVTVVEAHEVGGKRSFDAADDQVTRHYRCHHL